MCIWVYDNLSSTLLFSRHEIFLVRRKLIILDNVIRESFL